MNSSTEDIKDLLVAESALGLDFAENLFISREPDKPDLCVTLFDTEGLPPGVTLGKETYDMPSIQIRVRAPDHKIGWAMVNDIADYLHMLSHTEINGTYYSLILKAGGPSFLDWDVNNRIRFIVNFNLIRR